MEVYLNVQAYLTERSFEDLTEEFGIRVQRHNELPLVILNYNQIESHPKTHPIVRECRGLVLHTETKCVVAKGMHRFFNWGETQDEMQLFDFSDFVVQSKEDGSLFLVYHFDGQWRANTRGSFGEHIIEFQTFTWQEAFCSAIGSTLSEFASQIPKSLTLVCEFCSLWTKVVRSYNTPTAFLLTAFDNRTGMELATEECDDLVRGSKMLRPDRHHFKSIEEIQDYLSVQQTNDPTFEGVVIRDKNNLRFKIKSPTYLGLHRLKGNDNIWNPKYLLPFVLSGEESELLTYFPEAKESFYQLKSRVLEKQVELLEVWGDHKDIENQKEFALSIQGKSPFTSLLFEVRKKHGQEQKSKDLRSIWKDSSDSILKHI